MISVFEVRLKTKLSHCASKLILGPDDGGKSGLARQQNVSCSFMGQSCLRSTDRPDLARTSESPQVDSDEAAETPQA